MGATDQPLLLILIAFLAGAALGTLGSWLRRRRSGERDALAASSIHYVLGIDLLASRQLDRAVSELTKAARANTEATEIYLILGNLLREKGQLERAIQIHQSVLHRPRLSQEQRAHALLCLGMDFKRAGLRDRAVATLNDVVRLQPDSTYALSSLVKIHEEARDWDQALSNLTELERVTGESEPTLRAHLLDQLGQEARRNGDSRKAERAFEGAGAAAPALAPPHLHYGELLESQGRLEQAESRWAAFADAHPRLAHLVFEPLARVRAELGRSERMEELYRDVIERDEHDWRAHVALAELRRESGDPEAAFELRLGAVRNCPHTLAVHLAIWGGYSGESVSTETVRRYLSVVEDSALFVDPYLCVKCGYRANGMVWRCPHCQEWDTFVEERIESTNPTGPP